jgi:histidine triad (HIT) family protein
MYNHAPTNYTCPICIGIQDGAQGETLIRQSDIVYHDNLVTALINSFFIGKNAGHVIIVPNEHIENIYDLPLTHATRIAEVAQKIALAIKKVYNAEGITTMQNNEPAGNQHAFHYHLHIFPRYENDDFYNFLGKKQTPTPEERKSYAEKIKKYL